MRLINEFRAVLLRQGQSEGVVAAVTEAGVSVRMLTGMVLVPSSIPVAAGDTVVVRHGTIVSKRTSKTTATYFV
jgi:hypothetical protein